MPFLALTQTSTSRFFQFFSVFHIIKTKSHIFKLSRTLPNSSRPFHWSLTGLPFVAGAYLSHLQQQTIFNLMKMNCLLFVYVQSPTGCESARLPNADANPCLAAAKKGSRFFVCSLLFGFFVLVAELERPLFWVKLELGGFVNTRKNCVFCLKFFVVAFCDWNFCGLKFFCKKFVLSWIFFIVFKSEAQILEFLIRFLWLWFFGKEFVVC